MISTPLQPASPRRGPSFVLPRSHALPERDYEVKQAPAVNVRSNIMQSEQGRNDIDDIVVVSHPALQATAQKAATLTPNSVHNRLYKLPPNATTTTTTIQQQQPQLPFTRRPTLQQMPPPPPATSIAFAPVHVSIGEAEFRQGEVAKRIASWKAKAKPALNKT